MKFALMQLVSGRPGCSPAQIYHENLELAVEAERLGFHSVWVAEHHFNDYGLVPNILQYMAALAARTTTIRLGTGVVVSPLHHPIRLAEEVGFLDQLSGGRLDLGLGRGYQPAEFAAFGCDIEESTARFDESVAFLRRAWGSEEPFDWDGRFWQGRGISILPRPVQQPHPPMWLACTSPPTFSRAGEQGWQILTSPNFSPIKMVQDNFALYHRKLEAHGHDPSGFEFPMMQQVYVGRDAAAAYTEPMAACMSYFDKLGRLLPDEVTGGATYAQMRRTKMRIANIQYNYLWDNAVAFGDAQRVIDRLTFYQEELGMDYFIGWFNFGDLDAASVKASLHRFAEQVMPAFAIEVAA